MALGWAEIIGKKNNCSTNYMMMVDSSIFALYNQSILQIDPEKYGSEEEKED